MPRRSPHPERAAICDTYTERVTPQVLLPSEPLATGLTRIGPLPRVRADVPLKDALLFGGVGAERTLMQLDGHHQHVTWGTNSTISSSGTGCPLTDGIQGRTPAAQLETENPNSTSS